MFWISITISTKYKLKAYSIATIEENCRKHTHAETVEGYFPEKSMMLVGFAGYAEHS